MLLRAQWICLLGLALLTGIARAELPAEEGAGVTAHEVVRQTTQQVMAAKDLMPFILPCSQH